MRLLSVSIWHWNTENTQRVNGLKASDVMSAGRSLAEARVSLNSQLSIRKRTSLWWLVDFVAHGVNPMLHRLVPFMTWMLPRELTGSQKLSFYSCVTSTIIFYNIKSHRSVQEQKTVLSVSPVCLTLSALTSITACRVETRELLSFSGTSRPLPRRPSHPGTSCRAVEAAWFYTCSALTATWWHLLGVTRWTGWCLRSSINSLLLLEPPRLIRWWITQLESLLCKRPGQWHWDGRGTGQDVSVLSLFLPVHHDLWSLGGQLLCSQDPGSLKTGFPWKTRCPLPDLETAADADEEPKGLNCLAVFFCWSDEGHGSICFLLPRAPALAVRSDEDKWINGRMSHGFVPRVMTSASARARETGNIDMLVERLWGCLCGRRRYEWVNTNNRHFCWTFFFLCRGLPIQRHSVYRVGFHCLLRQ